MATMKDLKEHKDELPHGDELVRIESDLTAPESDETDAPIVPRNLLPWAGEARQGQRSGMQTESYVPDEYAPVKPDVDRRKVSKAEQEDLKQADMEEHKTPLKTGQPPARQTKKRSALPKAPTPAHPDAPSTAKAQSSKDRKDA